MKQTDKEVNPIGRWGCVFMVLCEIARREAVKWHGSEYSDEELGEKFRLAYIDMAGTWKMSSKCYVHDNRAVLAGILRQFGLSANISVWDGGQPGDYTRLCFSTKWGFHYLMDDYNPDETVPILGKIGERHYNVTVRGEK